MHWSHCHSGKRSLTPISPVPISVVTGNLPINKYVIIASKFTAQFECLIITCSHQRAPLGAMTELPRSSSGHKKHRKIESKSSVERFAICTAPGQGPCSHCYFCIACKDIFKEMVLRGIYSFTIEIEPLWLLPEPWPECEVAFVVCCDEDCSSNFLSWLITPATTWKGDIWKCREWISPDNDPVRILSKRCL